MATFKKGILGGFSGKVGNVIGSSFRGLDVLKSLPKKSRSLATESQKEQRARFTMAIKFLSPFKALIEKGFGKGRNTLSSFNLAMSYHVREAITGFMPNLTINYAKVVLTKGELLAPRSAMATAVLPEKISFTWLDNSGAMGNENDRAIFFVYNPVKHAYESAITSKQRIDGNAVIEVPSAFVGDTVHCWMAYISIDDKYFSTSVYLGTVTIV